jgi:hypothetical protein
MQPYAYKRADSKRTATDSPIGKIGQCACSLLLVHLSMLAFVYLKVRFEGLRSESRILQAQDPLNLAQRLHYD